MSISVWMRGCTCFLVLSHVPEQPRWRRGGRKEEREDKRRNFFNKRLQGASYECPPIQISQKETSLSARILDVLSALENGHRYTGEGWMAQAFLYFSFSGVRFCLRQGGAGLAGFPVWSWELSHISYLSYL